MFLIAPIYILYMILYGLSFYILAKLASTFRKLNASDLKIISNLLCLSLVFNAALYILNLSENYFSYNIPISILSYISLFIGLTTPLLILVFLIRLNAFLKKLK